MKHMEWVWSICVWWRVFVYLWHCCSDAAVSSRKLRVSLFSRLYGMREQIPRKGRKAHRPEPKRIKFNPVGSLHVLHCGHTWLSARLLTEKCTLNPWWIHLSNEALKATWSGPALSYELLTPATRLHQLTPDHFCKSLSSRVVHSPIRVGASA